MIVIFYSALFGLFEYHQKTIAEHQARIEALNPSVDATIAPTKRVREETPEKTSEEPVEKKLRADTEE